jgi:hypothetical protein
VRRRGRRAAVLGGLALVVVPSAACTVGSGVGSAVGTLMVIGCNEQDSLAKPQPYSLHPTFFAGEPIEDVCPPMMTCGGPHTNRLLIRMQRNGNAIEVNDTLYFDIENSYEVARCLRGRINDDGTPDWDTRLVTGPDGAVIPGKVWCDWNWVATPDGGAADAGPSDASAAADAAVDGGTADAGVSDAGAAQMTQQAPRINISTADNVRSSLSPLDTCISARLVGIALPGSWIQFDELGSVEQPLVSPNERTRVGYDYYANFGDRLHATFHVVLGDQRVVTAIQMREAIPPTFIDGVLDGSFDFDLERGRAAQPFP